MTEYNRLVVFFPYLFVYFSQVRVQLKKIILPAPTKIFDRF